MAFPMSSGGLAPLPRSPLPCGPTCWSRAAVRAPRALARARAAGEIHRVDAAYHLLWSPNFLQRTALVSAVLLILTSAPRLFHRAWVTAPLVAHAWEVLCPLLASACCALQLLFNLLNAGCAGFNKYLGPWRPLFLGFLLTSPMPSLRWRCAQLIIAFLPELLHLYQTRFRRKRRDRPRGSLRALRRVELRVPGMGCVACINKVQEALSAVPGVHLCDAWLEQGAGGFATVSCTPSTSSGALLSALHHAGFDAERKDAPDMTQESLK
ncbi:unnamed protein product [Durusdinium trenchii]|uniref:HMA domain-containing protein n=2 Tax=Durusdinium trenchii TaxID=1381693 RepID=A0ABP0NNH4_9DINO